MTLRWLALSPLLGALGCLSDFSPDPFNEPWEAEVVDAGSADAGRDAGRRPSTRDARTEQAPEEEKDAGELPTDESMDEPAAPPPASPCDLSGSWLLTERTVTSALGARQVNYQWFYLELTQQGDALTVSKSLACGAKVVGLAPTIISMDDKKAWPAYMQQPSYGGRKGTSTASASGCDVSFEKMALVRGATVETYRDLSLPLPTAQEPASDGTPGWEDWDDDGKPGVSMRVMGTLTGTLFAATRTWTQYGGTIAPDASTFWLPVTWGQERSNLGYDGSPLLVSADAGRDPDASQHVAEMTRFSAEQAAGEDAVRCERVRELAPALTPRAME